MTTAIDNYLDEVVSDLGYTRQQLNDAFKMVHDPDDWKAPINNVIPGHPVTKEKVREAILFYTATNATFTELDDGRCRVEAAGYRLGPAGDH
jgi:hypothetical protein